MRTPRSSILAGLGNLSRDEMAHLIAIFNDTKLWNMARDKVKDAINKRRRPHAARTFESRLRETTQAIIKSDESTAAIRFRLWALLREALQLPPALPLSIRAAELASVRVGHHAVRVLSKELSSSKEAPADGRAARLFRSAKSLIKSPQPLDFDEALLLFALGLLSTEEKKQTHSSDAQTQAFLEHLAELPSDQRNEAIMRALRQGDQTLSKLLVAGGTLGGLGIAVEFAGFSAYILAAQASAFIPFVSGKALVSTLFVVANPLFLVPAMIGGSWWGNKKLTEGIGQRLAASTVMMLALSGVASPRQVLKQSLDDFRSLSPEILRRSAAPQAATYAASIDMVRKRIGDELAPAPVIPPGILAKPQSGREDEDLQRLLSSSGSSEAAEAGVVAGLTVGDLLYTIASIDPNVVIAADFSRTADLSDIFQFGGFAEEIMEKSGASYVGAVENLKGYVAEQVVATKLVQQGHQVSFPDMSNNPGYDLLVDGAPFQVKCLESTSGLAEHFVKYPDIPVLANAELASDDVLSQVWWGDMVHFTEGFTDEAIRSVTDTALENGSELLDLDVPLFVIAVSATKNLYYAFKGDLALSELPLEVALDMAVRGGVSAAGGFAGQTLGLLVFGPAGAVVFGGTCAVAALFQAKHAKMWLNKKRNPDWYASLKNATFEFSQSLELALEKKIALLDEKIAVIHQGDSSEIKWIRERIKDDKLFLFESVGKLKQIDLHAPGQAAQALFELAYESGVHSWTVRQQQKKLLDLLQNQPDPATLKWHTSKRHPS